MNHELRETHLSRLLRVLKFTGGKFIIIENGMPQAVLMEYKEFERLLLYNNTSKVEKINKEITKAQLEESGDDLFEEVIDQRLTNLTNDLDDEITIEPL